MNTNHRITSQLDAMAGEYENNESFLEQLELLLEDCGWCLTDLESKVLHEMRFDAYEAVLDIKYVTGNWTGRLLCEAVGGWRTIRILSPEEYLEDEAKEDF